MMLRYIILAGRHIQQRRQIAANLGLRLHTDLERLTILATSATPREPLDGPILIGEVLGMVGPSGTLTEPRLETVISATSLCEQIWGRYVAVFRDDPAGIRVLRDPGGALGCYYRQTDDLIVIASDLALLDKVTGKRTLDWEEIGRTLVETDLRSSVTAISDTHELLPGHVLTVRAGVASVSPAWSPWEYARRRRATSFEDAALALREQVDTVVMAMTGGHRDVTATVSGGLDSSIIALSIPRTITVNCITLATRDPSGDERRYARLVAEAVSPSYAETVLEASSIDLGRSQAVHLPRPIGRPFFVPIINAIENAARSNGSLAIVNGLGGDNVFCFLQSATPAADRAASGDPLGALQTVADIARMTGASYRRVASAAMRRALQGRRPRAWRRDHRYVSAELVHDVPAFAHPWLQPPVGGRLGTGAHISMLLRIQNYLDPWRPDQPFDVLNPLLAQPIVEHCLGIPTWRWCQSGVDRAVARHAFADRLPPAIRQRAWKGGPDGFIASLAERQRESVRAMLIDGHLAERGLIDRAAVGLALDDRRPLSASNALRLLMLTDAEAWVRAHG